MQKPLLTFGVSLRLLHSRPTEAVSDQRFPKSGTSGARAGASSAPEDEQVDDLALSPTSWLQRKDATTAIAEPEQPGCCGGDQAEGKLSNRGSGADVNANAALSADELARKLGYRAAPELLLGCMLVAEFNSTRGALESDGYTTEPLLTYVEFEKLVNHYPWRGGWGAFASDAFSAEISPWDLHKALAEKAKNYEEHKEKWVVPYIVKHAVAVPIPLTLKMKDGKIDEDSSTREVGKGTGMYRRVQECKERLRGWYQIDELADGRAVETCKPVGTTWLRPKAAYELTTEKLGEVYQKHQISADAQRGNLFARLYDEVDLLYTKSILPLASKLGQDPAHPEDPSRQAEFYTYENQMYRAPGGFYKIKGQADVEGAVNADAAPAPQLLPILFAQEGAAEDAGKKIDYLYLRRDASEVGNQTPFLSRFAWGGPGPAPERGGIKTYAEEVFRRASFLGLLGPYEELVRSMFDMAREHVPHLAGQPVGGDVPTVAGILHEKFACPADMAQRTADLVAANKGKDFDVPAEDEAKCGLKWPWGLQRTGIPEQDALITFEYALKQHFRRDTFTGRYFVEVCTQLARLNFHSLTHAEEALMSAEGRFHGPQPMLGIYVDANELFRRANKLFLEPEYIFFSYLHQKYVETTDAATRESLVLSMNTIRTKWAGDRREHRLNFDLPMLDGEPGGLEVKMLYYESEKDQVYDGVAMQVFDRATLALPEKKKSTTQRLLAFSELKGQGSHVLERLGALLEANAPEVRPDLTVHHGSLLLLDAIENSEVLGGKARGPSRQAKRELAGFKKFADVMSGKDTYAPPGDAAGEQALPADAGGQASAAAFTQLSGAAGAAASDLEGADKHVTVLAGEVLPAEEDAEAGGPGYMASSKKFMPKAAGKTSSFVEQGRKTQQKTLFPFPWNRSSARKHTTVLGTGSHDATLAVFPPGDVDGVTLPSPCFAPDWRDEMHAANWQKCVMQQTGATELIAKLDAMLSDPEAFAASLTTAEANKLLRLSYSKQCIQHMAVQQEPRAAAVFTGGSVAVSGASRYGRESPQVERGLGANRMKVQDTLWPAFWKICAVHLEMAKPRVLLSSENLLVSDPPSATGSAALQDMAQLRRSLPASTNVVFQSARLGYNLDGGREGADAVFELAAGGNLPRVPPGMRLLPGQKLIVNTLTTGPLLHPVMPPMFVDVDLSEIDESAAEKRGTITGGETWTKPTYVILDALSKIRELMDSGIQGKLLQEEDITRYCGELRAILYNKQDGTVTSYFGHRIGVCVFHPPSPEPDLCKRIQDLKNPPALKYGVPADGSGEGTKLTVGVTSSGVTRKGDVVAKCATDMPFAVRIKKACGRVHR
eukprot:g5430.t1